MCTLLNPPLDSFCLFFRWGVSLPLLLVSFRGGIYRTEPTSSSGRDKRMIQIQIHHSYIAHLRSITFLQWMCVLVTGDSTYPIGVVGFQPENLYKTSNTQYKITSIEGPPI